MAKITAEYDTQTKKLSVKKDGEALSNVHGIEFGRDYDSLDKSDTDANHQMHLRMRQKGDDGCTTHTHLTANEKGELVQDSGEHANTALAGYFRDYLNSRRGNRRA